MCVHPTLGCSSLALAVLTLESPRSWRLCFDGTKIRTFFHTSFMWKRKTYTRCDTFDHNAKKQALVGVPVVIKDVCKLDLELVAKSELEHRVVRLLVGVGLLESLSQTDVVASVKHDVLVLVRETNGNCYIKLVAVFLD